MPFTSAVAQTPGLEGACRSGLQALSKADRQHIDAEHTDRIAGSVNVDAALIQKYPHDPRWDYAIGHRPSNLNGWMVYWVEIHPATSGEIKAVLAKLKWLKGWLREFAPRLNVTRREFIWVSSGKTYFTPLSTQQKRMASAGLQFKGRVFRIPDKAAIVLQRSGKNHTHFGRSRDG